MLNNIEILLLVLLLPDELHSDNNTVNSLCRTFYKSCACSTNLIKPYHCQEYNLRKLQENFIKMSSYLANLSSTVQVLFWVPELNSFSTNRNV